MTGREKSNQELSSTEVMVSNVETLASKKDKMQTSTFYRCLCDQFSKPERHDVLKEPTPFLVPDALI